MRIASYARYSTVKQSARSIEDQQRMTEQRALEAFGVGVAVELRFMDAAESAQGSDRAGYKALKRAIAAHQVDVVIVDEMSRLSRNMGETMRLCEDMRFENVRLLSCDGVDSSVQGSKSMIAMKAVFDEHQLDVIRHETRRGMLGRARAGHATGGLAYGYESKAVQGLDGTPSHFEHHVRDDEARVVRRAFELYLTGWSPARIAGAFNEEGIPSPRAGMRYRKKGWVDTTIRAWLGNKAYVGVKEWGRREWVKVPGTNTRRARMRAEPLQVTEVPHLRIVDAETWDAVQARRAAVRAKYTRTQDGRPKGRVVPGNSAPQAFSGVLACGACGAPMVINGGVRRRYACSHARQRRTCSNRLTVKVSVVEDVILGELESRFTNPVALAYLRRRLAGRVDGAKIELARELAERRDRLSRTEARGLRLVETVADGFDSESVRTSIRDYDAQAREERLRIAALERQMNTPTRMLTNREIRRRVLSLRSVVRQEPVHGREALLQLFGGQLRLVPGDDGVYTAEGDLAWLGFVLSPSKQKPSEESPGRVLGPIEGLSCGGPQRAALANSRASHGGPNCLLTALQGQILGLPRTRLQVRQRPEGHARANPQQSCPRSSAPAPSGAPQGCPGATASSS